MPKKILFLRGSGPPNITIDSFKNETYVLLLKGMIKRGLFDEAKMLYVNSQTEGIIRHQIDGNIEVVQSPDNNIYKGEHFDFVFIRAQFQEYPIVLDGITYDKLGFYSANHNIFPHITDPKKIDIFYVNSEEEIRQVKRKYPWIKNVTILDKPIDESIFKPMNIEKKYDICILANFRPRKHYTMLFEQIAKLPNKDDLNIISVGNLYSSEYEAHQVAYDYDIKVKFTGLVHLEEVAKILNQSKINVLAAKLEANPRALYESIACGTPIVINKEMTGGRHMANKLTGRQAKLWKLDKAIDHVLKNYKKYDPRKYFEESLSLEKIVDHIAKDFE